MNSLKFSGYSKFFTSFVIRVGPTCALELQSILLFPDKLHKITINMLPYMDISLCSHL